MNIDYKNINKNIIIFVIFLSFLGISTVNAIFENNLPQIKTIKTEDPEVLEYKPPKAFIYGEISDLTDEGFFTTFNAVNVRCIQLKPLSYGLYRSDEEITVHDRYMRILRSSLVFGIFGFIGVSSEPTPKIIFDKSGYRELSVVSCDFFDILWNDIVVIGECDITQPDAYVSVGDKITDCMGTIKIYYDPTEIMLGYWEFY